MNTQGLRIIKDDYHSSIINFITLEQSKDSGNVYNRNEIKTTKINICNSKNQFVRWDGSG